MTSENPVADRLLNDARKKESRVASSPLDIAALVISLVGLAGSGYIPLVGIVLGVVGVIVGVLAVRKPANTKLAWGGVAIGAIAIIVGVLYTLNNTGVI
jgi:hypothetical protein